MPYAPARTRALVAIWLAGVSLRSTIIGVSPLAPLLRQDLSLSYSQLGVILGLPLVTMCLCAVPGSKLSGRLGPIKAVVLGFSLVTLGGMGRALAFDFASLLVVTLALAVGIGLAQPVFPVLIKRRFPDRVGTATGIYANGMSVGAAMGAILTTPVLLPLSGDLTWRGPLLAWGAIATITLFLWLSLSGRQPAAEPPVAPPKGGGRPVWRQWRVWHIALLFGCQNVLFHAASAWIPTYYADRGWDLVRASLPLTAMMLTTLASSALFPMLADRYSRRVLLVLLPLFIIAAWVGILVAPEAGALLWGVALGLGGGGVFGIALMLPPSLARPDEVERVTGMVLMIAYGLAAVGPVLLGVLRDLTGTFAGGLMVALGLSFALIPLGWWVPQPKPAPAVTTTD